MLLNALFLLGIIPAQYKETGVGGPVPVIFLVPFPAKFRMTVHRQSISVNLVEIVNMITTLKIETLLDFFP